MISLIVKVVLMYAIKRSFSEVEIWGDLPKATKPF